MDCSFTTKGALAGPWVLETRLATATVSEWLPRPSVGVVKLHDVPFTIALPSRVAPSYTATTSPRPRPALRVPLRTGARPSVLVPLAKSPVSGPVVSVTWATVTTVVGVERIVSTVKSRVPLAAWPLMAVPVVPSSTMARTACVPSPSGAAGVKVQFVPDTVAMPMRVAPS